MSAAQEALDIITQSRKERREDLQEIIDSHVGTTATTILLFNQARLAARLTDADPNSDIDVPEGPATGSDFSSPTSEESS